MIDPSKRPPENRIHIFDPVGLINDSYASHVIRPRRPPTRSPNSGGSSPVRFPVETKSTEDSDSSSPRLWKSPSPDSRTQAIARGRKELMEMIKDMPESSYELSLRDIVDQKSPARTEKNSKSENSKVNLKRSESKKKVMRSRSIDNGGFLLKTSVFPISFWLNKNKKKGKNSNSISKSNSGSNGSFKNNRRKSGGLSEGESGGISSSNGGSTNSSRSSSSSTTTTTIRQPQSNRFLPDCLSFKAKK